MTVQFALDYAPRRARELGFGDKYVMRFRHLVLQPSEQVYLESYGGEFILLIEPALTVRVDSELGRYDMADEDYTTNEQQYEHQGEVVIENLDPDINHIRFIQVVPLHNEIIH